MEAENEEFFEAYEEIPPSPDRRQEDLTAHRQALASSRLASISTSVEPASSKEADSNEAVASKAPSQLAIDLSVWKAGPSSVRERRERFWQNVKQGKGGRPLTPSGRLGEEQLNGPHLTRLASENTARAAGSQKEHQRRCSEGSQLDVSDAEYVAINTGASARGDEQGISGSDVATLPPGGHMAKPPPSLPSRVSRSGPLPGPPPPAGEPSLVRGKSASEPPSMQSNLTTELQAITAQLKELRTSQAPTPVPVRKPPAAPSQLTENARPWPKRHHRTPSQSDNDVTPTTSPPASGHWRASMPARRPEECAVEDTPAGVIRVQDNSTGKEYAVEVVYRVKDLDTGKEFIVDEANGDTGGKVKDLASGQELSLNEFQDRLGLSPIMREVERRRGNQDAWDAALNGGGGQESEGGGQVDDASKKKKKQGWLKTLKKGAEYYSGIGSRIGKEYMGGGTRSDPETGDRSMSDGDVKGVKFARHRRGGSGGSEQQSRGWGPGFEAGPHGARSVKVHVHRKLYKELTDVRFGQEIKAHSGAIWCMKFNADGRFLATGGADRVVRVWEVVLRLPPTPLQADDLPDTPSSVRSSASRKGEGVATEFEVGTEEGASRRSSGEGATRGWGGSWGNSFWLADVPYRTFVGHTADVLDLCWSKNTQFLLSSSMDKTVRLWHCSMEECLRVFPHSDYVTCVEFNPVDDKYFVSGSLDNKVRIWNIPENHVVDWTDMREMVTACTYTHDGKGVIVGSYESTCRFYNAAGHKLQLDAHIDVRSTRGKNSHGKKITGVQCMPGDSRRVLVTSNDSRIRVYDGMKLQCKYKGHRNVNSQIQAWFSANGDFIVCASEDSYVYVWSTVNSFVPSINPVYTGYRKDKHQSYEYFYSHGTNVAISWPGITRPHKDPPSGTPTPASEDQSMAKPEAAQSRAGGSSDGVGQRAGHIGDPGSKGEGAGRPGGVRKESEETLSDSGGDVGSATWPEEELRSRHTPFKSCPSPGPGPWATPAPEPEKLEDVATAVAEANAAGEAAVAAAAGVGLVIVTAGHGGEIRTFKNFGYPMWL